MCGRFVSVSPPDELAAYFHAASIDADASGWRADTNVAPGGPVLAVVGGDPATRHIVALQWGLVPSWAKDPSVGQRMINARSETALTKPSFRRAAASRRALVPADGFYEWFRPPTGPKQPYLIRRPDGAPYAFGALWERWTPAEGGPELRTVAILTAAASRRMAVLHDRMPVLVDRADWDEWLGDERLEPDRFAAMCAAGGDEQIGFHPVSREVNNARNKGDELLAPVDPVAGAPVATSDSGPTADR